jgi:hypothetical protein
MVDLETLAESGLVAGALVVIAGYLSKKILDACEHDYLLAMTERKVFGRRYSILERIRGKYKKDQNFIKEFNEIKIYDKSLEV